MSVLFSSSPRKLTNQGIREHLASEKYPYALGPELVRNVLQDLKNETPPKIAVENNGGEVLYYTP